MDDPNNNPPAEKSCITRWRQRILKSLPMLLVVLAVALILILFNRIEFQAQAMKEAKAAQLKQEQPPINVVTLTLTPAELAERISLPAVVEPWVDLQLLTEVSGKVMEILVQEGDRVAKGDVIARLDDRDYRNAFQSAKASWRAARASHERISKLHAQQLATRSQLDDITAQMENFKAAMDTAALNLERCTITAPMNGVINHCFIDVGQFLSSADPVVQLLQIDRVKINVGIPESDVEAVRRLTKFQVTIQALGDRRFEATKHHLSRTADARARLYNLDLTLKNPRHEILPDMFARVEIIKRQVSDGLAVPLYAVISRNNRHFVYVVQDDTVLERDVVLGIQEGWQVQLAQGVSPDEAVVVVGQRSVAANEKVNVVRQVNDPRELVR
jgi:membrane fusion protein (multidrug efflux system)